MNLNLTEDEKAELAKSIIANAAFTERVIAELKEDFGWVEPKKAMELLQCKSRPQLLDYCRKHRDLVVKNQGPKKWWVSLASIKAHIESGTTRARNSTGTTIARVPVAPAGGFHGRAAA